MGGNYRNHLLVQIELLRCVISHEELGKRLGDVTERCLALPNARNLVLNNYFRFVHTWQHGHPEPDQAHPLSA
jgi:hypothetical protein